LTRRIEWGRIPIASSTLDPTGEFSVAEVNLEELIRGNIPAADLEVRPHDVISVAQAELVYVVSQVRKPGGFTMTGSRDFTVLQALSMAEGLERTAAPKKARILRRTGGEAPVEIPVNLDRMLAGKAPDTPLEPEDVLFIPNNAAKGAGMKTLDAIIQTTTGIAIYRR